MAHRFSGDPEILRSERRRRILPTDALEREVISRLKFRENAVDYGAGTGYFTEILAGHFRRVYAVEAESKMAEILWEEMEKRGIKNVGIIISDTPPDFDFQIDFILFSNVLHEVESPEKFMEWSRVARAVCIIDWKKIETEFGPPVDERIDLKTMMDLAKKNFRYVESPDIYPIHYTLVCYNEEDALKKADNESKNST